MAEGPAPNDLFMRGAQGNMFAAGGGQEGGLLGLIGSLVGLKPTQIAGNLVNATGPLAQLFQERGLIPGNAQRFQKGIIADILKHLGFLDRQTIFKINTLQHQAQAMSYGEPLPTPGSPSRRGGGAEIG